MGPDTREGVRCLRGWPAPFPAMPLFFTDGPVFDYPSAKRADTKKFGAFFHALLDRGVYLPPSQFEAAFASLAMGEREVEHTLSAARHAFRAL